jgi:maltooligosyltrehalose synthase
MVEAHKLAGFIAAHGIWCVSDGETLIPIYAYTNENNERILNRLVSEQLEEAVSIGKIKLENNEIDATDAVFIFDGRIPIEDKKYDSLIVEIRSYFSPESKVTMAIPYSLAEPRQTFRVHKPKYLLWENCEDFDLEVCVNSFFEGVDSHEKGAEVWNTSLDQSI